ncbi:TonB-dependent receptor [Parahaliea aestuarii]|uniref:TonB-dependent receptor n=1 Tax=Parahaliea aestuarii TaxID=1852021 RepID=A0A5C9A2I1_9GAMM|nr:TonB-dependent receptor [Parahaliea aestuarii]TXS95075.1 TonB-dependent receptor [Parahaliea aestuarii]
MRTNSRNRLPIACAVTAALGGPLPAYAQMALEEVVVTARKKEESIQDSPVAVSAVSKDTIDASFLGDATGIVQYSPNLIFDDISAGTPNGGGIAIRGISFQDVEKTFDPTVLIHLDGVPLGTNSGNAMSLLDVERIEVLRGPQGTLFGKNAVGGVINIHRTKPIAGQWAGKVRARAERYDAYGLEGVLNVPLGDNAAVKLNLAQVEKAGYFENITTGKDEGDSTEDRYGIHLLWDISDTFRAEVQYNSYEQDGTLAPMLSISGPQATLCQGFGACAVSDDKPLSGDRRKGAGDLEQDFELDSEDYQVDLNWEINSDLSAVLVAAHREMDEVSFLDFDGSPTEIFHAYRPNSYEQDSLELRFDYDAGDALSFTAGYFNWQSELTDWVNETDISLFIGVPVEACGFDGVPCSLQTAEASSDSDSVFFEGDYRLSDEWIVTAGARWIEETKKLTKTTELPVFGLVQLPTTTGERTDDDIIYRLGLRWEPTDDLMLYTTYSTGFRSGGFSIRASSPEIVGAGFEPEQVSNFEIGIKSTAFENRLRYALTAFYMEYDDMQQEVNIPLPGVGQGNQDAVLNVGSATIQGLELELSAIINDYFSVDFNGGYLDAEYDEFTGRIFGDGALTDDNSYLPMRRAPEFTYTAALNYLQDVGNGALTGRLSYNWRDDYAGTVTDFPGTHVDAYGVLDASLSYQFGNWRVGVFGRNLTDEDEYSHTFVVAPNSDGSSLFGFATPRPPRTYGAELVYTFGDY